MEPEKVQAQKYVHDFDGESSMEFDPEAWHMLEELRTKICMDFDLRSSFHSMMENQLQWLIKAITEASDAKVKYMHVSTQGGFIAISVKLDSIFATVSKVTPEKAAM